MAIDFHKIDYMNIITCFAVGQINLGNKFQDRQSDTIHGLVRGYLVETNRKLHWVFANIASNLLTANSTGVMYTSSKYLCSRLMYKRLRLVC